MSPSDLPGRKKPRLAITVGDVAGVGPEIALKAASRLDILARCDPILVGSAAALETIANRLGLSVPESLVDGELDRDLLGPRLADIGEIAADALVPGKANAETGKASFDAVNWAISQAMAHRVDGIVTGPIQKEAWHDAGTGYLGHTELLADRTGSEDVCMMLSGPEVSSILCTIHIPFAEVVEQLTADRITRAIRLGGLAMEQRHGRAPRITVLALNPHAGENGLLGKGEEESLIQPAVEAAVQWAARQGRQWTIRGPVPPDTAFTPAMRAETDVHVCMYHDQGLIPLKALSFDDAVNVTLGLPIVRTSVDHGTALDRAWQGTASPNSLYAAIEMAIELSREIDVPIN